MRVLLSVEGVCVAGDSGWSLPDGRGGVVSEGTLELQLCGGCGGREGGGGVVVVVVVD